MKLGSSSPGLVPCIEDLIAHREHRNRISGPSLLAAFDQTCEVPYPDVLSIHSGDTASAHEDDRDPALDTCFTTYSSAVSPSGQCKCWEGPELLGSPHDGGTSGHAEFLATTLAEHRQHLASAKSSKKKCDVNSYTGKEKSIDEVSDITSKLSNAQLAKVAASPTLEYPHLFSSTPSSSGKDGNAQRLQLNFSTKWTVYLKALIFHIFRILRKFVREAALAVPCCNTESS
ncbi:hypothetical protein MKW98_001441 [Papaver atlanticum]|uniref:Uncharacterized protein n=1 Tax=Papaver atlanticum TaxID=357466 RepID=A0AAD4SVF2_9MAGN|nr:hypothetical protein MKW98_001441 [Papaver atlanticum]